MRCCCHRLPARLRSRQFLDLGAFVRIDMARRTALARVARRAICCVLRGGSVLFDKLRRLVRRGRYRACRHDRQLQPPLCRGHRLDFRARVRIDMARGAALTRVADLALLALRARESPMQAFQELRLLVRRRLGQRLHARRSECRACKRHVTLAAARVDVMIPGFMRMTCKASIRHGMHDCHALGAGPRMTLRTIQLTVAHVRVLRMRELQVGCSFSARSPHNGGLILAVVTAGAKLRRRERAHAVAFWNSLVTPNAKREEPRVLLMRKPRLLHHERERYTSDHERNDDDEKRTSHFFSPFAVRPGSLPKRHSSESHARFCVQSAADGRLS